MSDPTHWSDELIAQLRQEPMRQSALDSLSRLPADERAAKIDARLAGALVLLLGDPSRTRQREAADVLQHLVNDAPALAQALESALGALDPRLRWGAAYTLGHALRPPPERLWPAVRETLALEDGDQRWAAAELTCELARHHASVRTDVVDTAQGGSPTMRRMLLYCLRDLGDPELLSVAGSRLGDEDAGVRLAALAASAQATRSPAETETLSGRIAALVDGDPDAGVRRAAAATLGRLETATAEAHDALQRAAAGEDPSLQRAARAALRRLGADSEQN